MVGEPECRRIVPPDLDQPCDLGFGRGGEAPDEALAAWIVAAHARSNFGAVARRFQQAEEEPRHLAVAGGYGMVGRLERGVEGDPRRPHAARLKPEAAKRSTSAAMPASKEKAART